MHWTTRNVFSPLYQTTLKTTDSMGDVGGFWPPGPSPNDRSRAIHVACVRLPGASSATAATASLRTSASVSRKRAATAWRRVQWWSRWYQWYPKWSKWSMNPMMSCWMLRICLLKSRENCKPLGISLILGRWRTEIQPVTLSHLQGLMMTPRRYTPLRHCGHVSRTLQRWKN